MDYRKRMINNINPSYAYSLLPEERKIIIRKFPKKAIILAVILFSLGSILIIIGSFLLCGYMIPIEYNDRTWPILTLGIVMFIPGAYYTRIAAYAYKKYPGFSYSDIPDFSD